MAIPLTLQDLPRLVAQSPYLRFLDLRLRMSEPGRVQMEMPYRPEFDTGAGDAYIHGGIIASLLDTVACFAVISQVLYEVPTVDLRVDYLRPARREPLVATGWVVKLGRVLSVADAEARNPRGQVVAVGRGLFSTAGTGASSP